MKPPSSSVLAIVMATLATGAAVAVAAPGKEAATVHSTSNSVLGTIVVDSGGRTLYRTTAACTGSCTLSWRPLLVPAGLEPIAGPGTRTSLLGRIKRSDGRFQVTYDRLPVYLFSGDTKAGQVTGQGVGGTWHAFNPSGKPVTRAPSGTAPAGASVASPGMSSASGSGSATAPATSSTTSSPTGGANPGMWCAANPRSCVDGVPIPGTQ